jgi:hypothetical protein
LTDLFGSTGIRHAFSGAFIHELALKGSGEETKAIAIIWSTPTIDRIQQMRLKDWLVIESSASRMLPVNQMLIEKRSEQKGQSGVSRLN